MSHLFRNISAYRLLTISAILLPLILALIYLLLPTFKLWYDPARDLLSAWNNLSKPTLIGPTSGIPGLFYGPYWIWLLSFGLLFSKNPIMVTFITATLPYFILFPLIWFRLSKYFNRTSLILGWLLFILGSGMTYATQLWNPYPAPLLAMVSIFLLITVDFTKISRREVLLTILTGFLVGLMVNFHISFGIAFLCGVIIFFLANLAMTLLRSAKTKRLALFFNELAFALFLGVGFFIAFLPTIFFEVRHGFHQIQALLHTFLKFGGGIVTVHGMSKIEIIQAFFNTYAKLLHLPVLIATILLIAIIILFIFQKYRGKIAFKREDEKILLLISSLFAGVLFIYLTAKNPIWEYHFIGVDVLFLFLITYISTKLPIFRKILLIWTLIILVVSVIYVGLKINNKESYFKQQQDIVKSISQDAHNTNYAVYAYSPSIYMYEYAYLFLWIANKNVPYDPGQIKPANTIYLILPPKKDNLVTDFIHFRSPQKEYVIVKKWESKAGITVIKSIKR